MNNEMNKFYNLLDQIEAFEKVEGLGMADHLRSEAEQVLAQARAVAAAPKNDHPIVNHLTEMMA